MPRDVPVLGTAAGTVAGSLKGFSLDTAKVVDHVRRPPGLAKAADAYAVYVVGDSMSPMHEDGALRFVHPHRPVVPGDTILIQIRAGEDLPIQAFIKVLLARSDDKIIVSQLRPKASIEIKPRTVVAIHHVMTTNELFEA